MSKIALSGNASGTGTLTIAAPNTSTDRTLTLPDNSGTLLSNASTAGFPAGSVLQVVSATLATSFSTTSTSAVNVTGFAASITPLSSTSKILVIVSSRTSHSSGGFINTRGTHWLYRGASNLCNQFTGSYIGGMSATDINQYHSSVISYLDSPATTSLVTYQIKASSDSPNNTMSTIGGDSTITLIEIAA